MLVLRVILHCHFMSMANLDHEYRPLRNSHHLSGNAFELQLNNDLVTCTDR